MNFNYGMESTAFFGKHVFSLNTNYNILLSDFVSSCDFVFGGFIGVTFLVEVDGEKIGYVESIPYKGDVKFPSNTTEIFNIILDMVNEDNKANTNPTVVLYIYVSLLPHIKKEFSNFESYLQYFREKSRINLSGDTYTKRVKVLNKDTK